MKKEVLKSLDFNHFTSKELASDVKISGLYSKDRIIERMQELYEKNDREVKEERNLLEQKHVDALKVIEKEIREDMKAVRDSVVQRVYNGERYWGYVPSNIRQKYQVL